MEEGSLRGPAMGTWAFFPNMGDFAALANKNRGVQPSFQMGFSQHNGDFFQNHGPIG